MGNKKNAVKWLPADHLRIMAFARSLAPDRAAIDLGKEPKVSDIQEVLSKFKHAIHISAPTIRSWVVGKKFPSAGYVNWIKQGMPECADWLTPSIDSSPIRRFLSALDIWGSPIDSAVRKLNTVSKEITVGMGLATLARRWASLQRNAGRNIFVGAIIPRLNCPVPQQVPDNIYQFFNPLSLMDFMFRCGPYLELLDEDFTEWAIDLASLTLLSGAFFEGTSLVDRLETGATGDYSSLMFDIFFRAHDHWPNSTLVKLRLEDFPEFDDSVIDGFSQRLVHARDVLNKELFAIGCDLSIALKVSENIKDGHRMWQESLDDSDGETFPQRDMLRTKRKTSPAAPGRYQYEFRCLSNGKQIARCHDLELGNQASLLERPDLYNGYKGQVSWGYPGEGPTFLTISILAHHLGHDDFGTEEIDQLRNMYISRIPERFIETPFFLTTELIDKCINE